VDDVIIQKQKRDEVCSIRDDVNGEIMVGYRRKRTTESSEEEREEGIGI
jgi:hypothetical protein